MIQLGLFDATRHLVPLPRARASDPATSAQAAASARQLAGAHCAAILAVLRQATEPLTAEQIADLAGLTGLQVARRLAGLRRAGAVVIVDSEGTTSAGRSCQRYLPGGAA